jgi:hypothetical protein
LAHNDDNSGDTPRRAAAISPASERWLSHYAAAEREGIARANERVSRARRSQRIAWILVAAFAVTIAVSMIFFGLVDCDRIVRRDLQDDVLFCCRRPSRAHFSRECNHRHRLAEAYAAQSQLLDYASTKAAIVGTKLQRNQR